MIIIATVSFPVGHNKLATIICRQNVAQTAVVMKEGANEIRDHGKQKTKKKMKKKVTPTHPHPEAPSFKHSLSRAVPLMLLEALFKAVF